MKLTQPWNSKNSGLYKIVQTLNDNPQLWQLHCGVSRKIAEENKPAHHLTPHITRPPTDVLTHRVFLYDTKALHHHSCQHTHTHKYCTYPSWLLYCDMFQRTASVTQCPEQRQRVDESDGQYPQLTHCVTTRGHSRSNLIT